MYQKSYFPSTRDWWYQTGKRIFFSPWVALLTSITSYNGKSLLLAEHVESVTVQQNTPSKGPEGPVPAECLLAHQVGVALSQWVSEGLWVFCMSFPDPVICGPFASIKQPLALLCLCADHHGSRCQGTERTGSNQGPPFQQSLCACIWKLQWSFFCATLFDIIINYCA